MSTDVTGFGGTSGSGGSIPIGSTGGVSGSPSQAVNDEQYLNTLSKSEVEAILLMLAAQFPILMAPKSEGAASEGVSGVSSANKGFAAIQSTIMETQNQIISDMWDSYIKNIREQYDLAKEKAEKDDIVRQYQQDGNKNRPMSSGEYMTYLLSVSINQRFDEINSSSTDNALSVQFNAAFKDWIVDPAAKTDPSVAAGNYPKAEFVVGAIASNPDSVRQAIGAGTAENPQLSVSPVADALVALGPVSALPADYQAAAALVAALLNGGAVGKATQETIEGAVKGGQPPRDVEFAMNYAKNILSIVTHDVGKGDAMSEDRNRLIKLMLTSMALNMLYRSAFHGMNAQEFIGLLNGDEIKGEIPQEIKDMFSQLVSQINGYLPKGGAEREVLLAQLGNYVDSKDSIDSMLDTTKLFVAMMGTDTQSKRIVSAPS